MVNKKNTSDRHRGERSMRCLPR